MGQLLQSGQNSKLLAKARVEAQQQCEECRVIAVKVKFFSAHAITCFGRLSYSSVSISVSGARSYTGIDAGARPFNYAPQSLRDYDALLSHNQIIMRARCHSHRGVPHRREAYSSTDFLLPKFYRLPLLQLHQLFLGYSTNFDDVAGMCFESLITTPNPYALYFCPLFLPFTKFFLLNEYLERV